MNPPHAHYVLDTGIVGAIGIGGELAQRIEAETKIRSAPLRPLICVVTRGEIVAFMRRRGWGEKRQGGVQELLKNLVTVNIDDPKIWDGYADLKNYAESSGRSIGDNDLWIAATAMVVGACLLTTDKDFDPLHEAGLLQRLYFTPKL